jgi:fused signal recognition particle receptor
MEITGIILTKLDGTAKGGVILGICNELQVPVRFIGIGERVDDLRSFDAAEFVDALYDREARSAAVDDRGAAADVAQQASAHK